MRRSSLTVLSPLLLAPLAALGLAPATAFAEGQAGSQTSARLLHRIDAGTPQGLQELFQPAPEPLPFVGAHRGGAQKGFPENCLATFENTLRQTFAIMEIDPRYTKDGAIVLHHDETLERTTTGKGRLADFTLAELKQLRLKDREGNVTEFQIPALDEALEWARGKEEVSEGSAVKLAQRRLSMNPRVAADVRRLTSSRPRARASPRRLLQFMASRRSQFLGSLLSALAAWALVPLHAADLGGVLVRFEGDPGMATMAAELVGPFKLQIRLGSRTETRPLVIRVELPTSGRNVWPAADVEARDDSGKALSVLRPGIEWFKMLITLPFGSTTCSVQAVEPAGGWPNPTTTQDRTIRDTIRGVRLRIAEWHDGRAAALSLRFDDSHPTHLTKVVPILREYGFRGTFMVIPGADEPGGRRRSDFQARRAEWEALARQGDHELANHSAHHRGAKGDEEMEAEIGQAARAIWALTSGRSKLAALNLGGGTQWETTRTLRYYLEKYHQFDTSGSLGMDDVYGNRVAAFREHVETHLERGLWCRVHYHSIGDGLSSSEANFRATLDIVKEHAARLWIAGMADIHKYQTERNAAKLTLLKSADRQLDFQLSCSTDPTLYDQPLTLEVAPPSGWDVKKIVVKDACQDLLSTHPGRRGGIDALLFEVPPRSAAYSIALAP